MLTTLLVVDAGFSCKTLPVFCVSAAISSIITASSHAAGLICLPLRPFALLVVAGFSNKVP